MLDKALLGLGHGDGTSQLSGQGSDRFARLATGDNQFKCRQGIIEIERNTMRGNPAFQGNPKTADLAPVNPDARLTWLERSAQTVVGEQLNDSVEQLVCVPAQIALFQRNEWI